MSQTYQEIFDRVYDALVTQGCPSFNDYTACAYRGINDYKCAIGHLLTNEQMSIYKVMEGSSPDQFSRRLIRDLVTESERPIAHDITFLIDLQNAHDLCSKQYFVVDFKTAMTKVAVKYNLNFKKD